MFEDILRDILNESAVLSYPSNLVAVLTMLGRHTVRQPTEAPLPSHSDSRDARDARDARPPVVDGKAFFRLGSVELWTDSSSV